VKVSRILKDNFESKIESIDELKAFLRDYFESDEVDLFLFGSRARGDYNRFSDIDLGIYEKKNVDLKISLLREILENSNSPFKVDIVVLNNNDKFKDIVSKENVRWI